MNAICPAPGSPGRHAQIGVTLIETLIALVIAAVGLLALAGMILRSNTDALDAQQRARATVFLHDMAQRYQNGRALDWSTLIDSGPVGDTPPNCSGLAGAEAEYCSWATSLAGGNEIRAASAPVSTFRFVGCLTRPAGLSPNAVLITVAWSAPTPAPAPADTCGQGVVTDGPDAAVADQFRRAASVVVNQPVLTPAP